MEEPKAQLPSRSIPLPSTHWSEILLAAHGSPRALEAFAERYRQPVYAFLRRKGYQPDKADDLTQEFFLSLTDQRVLEKADKERGPFRPFLKTCLKNFLANAHDRDTALKRGGDRRIVTLDIPCLERVLAAAPDSDPGAEFDRQWALAIIARGRQRLAQALDARDLEIFNLTFSGQAPSHREIGGRFEMSEAAVSKAISRSRGLLREIVIEELRPESPEDTVAELQALIRALSSSGLPGPPL